MHGNRRVSTGLKADLLLRDLLNLSGFRIGNGSSNSFHQHAFDIFSVFHLPCEKSNALEWYYSERNTLIKKYILPRNVVATRSMERLFDASPAQRRDRLDRRRVGSKSGVGRFVRFLGRKGGFGERVQTFDEAIPPPRWPCHCVPLTGSN